MATKKKAARKRKKVTKKAGAKSATEVAVEQPEPETFTQADIDAAKKQAFNDGWEAAKLDAFVVTCEDKLPKGSVLLYPGVAKVLKPLAVKRASELHPSGVYSWRTNEEAHTWAFRFGKGEWAQAE